MSGLSDNPRGALLMMLSMAAFTLNDTCMKALSDTLPLAQAIFLRGLATTTLLAGLALATGAWPRRLPRRDWGLVALRTLAEIAAAYFFITALFNMPIANATAILQALPLAVTLAGAVFLGEAVGWRRVSAIVVGFLGVLLIVRPGAEGFTVYSLYALAAVAAVTVRDLAARRLSREVPSVGVALIAAAAVTVGFGAASAWVDWVPVTPRVAALLAGASVLIIGGYVFSVSAMRVGDIAAVAPFRYTGLIWALVLGLIVFGDWPAPVTLIGAALVVGSGVYTLNRESRRARARRMSGGP